MALLLNRVNVKLILVVNPRFKIDYKITDLICIFPMKVNVYKGNRYIHKFFVDWRGEDITTGVTLKILSGDLYYSFTRRETSYIAYHKHLGVIFLDENKEILVVVKSYPSSVFKYLYSNSGSKSWIIRLKML